MESQGILNAAFDPVNHALRVAVPSGTMVSVAQARTRTLMVPPALAQTVMASPPAIGAATTSSSITSSVLYRWDNTTYVGQQPAGAILPRNSGAGGYVDNASSNHINQPGRIEIMFEGESFEVITLGTGPTGSFRVLINDQYISLTETAATENDGVYHYHLIDLGSRKIVKVTLELTATSFGGFQIGPTCSAWKPRKRQIRALIVGDSVTEAATGTTSPLMGWAQHLGYRMGWEDIFTDGQGGTGWLNPGTSGASVFQTRLTYDYTYAPDVIVLFGGINDRPVDNAAYTAAALQAAVTSLLQNIAASAPVGLNSGVKPLVYVLGCWQPNATPTADETAANAAISAGVTAAGTGALFIDPTGWITGTGYAGATTGVGNGDFTISSDALHPVDEGHELVGFRVATAIAASYPGLV